MLFTNRILNYKINARKECGGDDMFEKNLKYYRLKKNMTKKKLADACGVTPMAISNYENGKRRPDMATIKKMAEALDVKVADFLAARNTDITIKHGEFRKQSTLTKGEQEYVREYVEEYFGRFFDAVDFLGGDPLPAPLSIGSITITGNVQTDANKLRKELGFSDSGPIGDIVGILENKGVLVLEMEIDNDKFSGMSGQVNRYPYVVINETMRPERKRTTIIHELAHLLFDWDIIPAGLTEEKYATIVAGAVLIPDKDIIRELGQKRTAITKDMILTCEEYGISTYLLVKRASQAGIISPNLEKNFYIKANKVNWKKNEPNMVEHYETPKLFEQLVYRAINEEGVSIQRGAELLHKTYQEVLGFCGLMGDSNAGTH